MTKTNKNKENGDSNSPTELGDIKKLMQENFKKLDDRMQAVENGLKENHREYLSMLKDVENKANNASDLAQSNSILQTKNSEKIKSVEFEISSFKNEISSFFLFFHSFLNSEVRFF